MRLVTTADRLSIHIESACGPQALVFKQPARVHSASETASS